MASGPPCSNSIPQRRQRWLSLRCKILGNLQSIRGYGVFQFSELVAFAKKRRQKTAISSGNRMGSPCNVAEFFRVAQEATWGGERKGEDAKIQVEDAPKTKSALGVKVLTCLLPNEKLFCANYPCLIRASLFCLTGSPHTRLVAVFSRWRLYRKLLERRAFARAGFHRAVGCHAVVCT